MNAICELNDAELDAVSAGAAVAGGLVGVAVNVQDVQVDVLRNADILNNADVAINVLGTQRGRQ